MTDSADSEKPQRGAWKKGQTGNPNGRPRLESKLPLDDLKKMEAMLLKATPEAIKILIKLMREAQTPEQKHKMATTVIDKLVVVSKEKDRKEDRLNGGETPKSTQEDGDDQPGATQVTFTLQEVGKK